MMAPLRILSLDISTKTGWALMLSSDEGAALLDFGKLPKISEPDDSPYPANYVDWAYSVFKNIIELVDRLAPDILVIEETVAGSKSVFSQKILEYIHFLTARMIRDSKIKCRYFLTGEWRVLVAAKMTTEEKKRNKAIKLQKASTGKKLAKDKNGKVMGKIGKKHVNVRRANEIFGLDLILAQEDIADATLLAYAYHVIRLGSV